MKKSVNISVLSALLVLIAAAGIGSSRGQENSRGTKVISQVTFADSIAPLLKRKCAPCHFAGGKVYGLHPFDSYEHVRSLGKKLNTRLKGDDAELVNTWVKGGFPNQRIGSDQPKR